MVVIGRVLTALTQELSQNSVSWSFSFVLRQFLLLPQLFGHMIDPSPYPAHELASVGRSTYTASQRNNNLTYRGKTERSRTSKPVNTSRTAVKKGTENHSITPHSPTLPSTKPKPQERLDFTSTSLETSLTCQLHPIN